MPIQHTGFLSRYDMEHPEDDTSPVEPYSLHELVLKYNPNHGPDGRFASSGGGRKGGTAGAPTEDAFGRPLRTGGKSQSQLIAEEFAGRAGTALGGMARNLVEKLPTNLKNKILGAVGTGGYGARNIGNPFQPEARRQASNDLAYRPGITPTPVRQTQEFRPGITPAGGAMTLEVRRPGALVVPKQFEISNAQKVRNYVEMFGKRPPRKKV